MERGDRSQGPRGSSFFSHLATGPGTRLATCAVNPEHPEEAQSHAGTWARTGSVNQSSDSRANHRQETWVREGWVAWLGLLPGYPGYRPSGSPRAGPGES